MRALPSFTVIVSISFALGFVFTGVAKGDTIATYPTGTVLENIAIGSTGTLFVSAINSGTVYEVTAAGSSQVFGNVPGPLLGLAFNTDQTLVGVGGTSVYRFASDGAASLIANVPGAQDLNGVTPFSPNTFLVADDLTPTIWQVNAKTGSSRAWVTTSLLAPSAALPIGGNGIKIFHGSVYISNTGAGTLIRVPINPDGSAGAPEIYVSSFQVDDFAFGSDGSIFAATQTGSLIHLLADGMRTSIPTHTFGDAAIAFGRTAADLRDIYVVNNGGVFVNPAGAEPASILQLSTNTTGIVPESQVVPEPVPAALLLGALALLILKSKKQAV